MRSCSICCGRYVCPPLVGRDFQKKWKVAIQSQPFTTSQCEAEEVTCKLSSKQNATYSMRSIIQTMYICGKLICRVFHAYNFFFIAPKEVFTSTKGKSLAPKCQELRVKIAIQILSKCVLFLHHTPFFGGGS